MMELTAQDRALVNDLINIAWQSGSVKSPQMGMLLEQLRAKVQKSTGAGRTEDKEMASTVKND